MKIGIVGCGVMGAAFTVRWLEFGADVTVWNRTPEKTLPLVEKGARLAQTPAQCASCSEVVVSSVKDDTALESVTFGIDGILAGLGSGCLHIDTSTISPQMAAGVFERYSNTGRDFVHAPVLGSKKQIAEGCLLVFANGRPDILAKVEKCFTGVASRIWRMEEPGRAAALKLACNMLIASMICGLSQSLVFGKKFGVDPELLLDVIQSSNLASPMYASKSKQILDRNWSANFFVDNIIKDVDLALASGQSAGISQPMLAIIRQLFAAAGAEGFGLEDYSAVSKIFEKLADVTLA